MKRVAVALALALLLGARALGEDQAPIAEADLQALAEKALAAAVTSSGKSTYALDDAAVQSEGGEKPELVLAALRAASAKAGVKFVKHAENLDVPMLRARFSTLVVSSAKETTTDCGLYLELEAANRALLHANVTNVHKVGPGGRTAGHHTAQTLDALADRFVVHWAEKPDASRLTLVGKAGSNSIAQQSLIERIIQRLLGAKAQVIAASRGSVDVERPKNVRLLGAQIGLLAELTNEADVLFVNASDLVRTGEKVPGYPYRDPAPGGAGAGPGAAVFHMKNLSRSAEFQFRNDGYRMKPAGAKGKVWILEAKIETGGGDALRNQLTEAARSLLVGHETPHWLFEAKDGEATTADAKTAGIDVIIQPILKKGTRGRKQALLEIRTVKDDVVVGTETVTYSDAPQK